MRRIADLHIHSPLSRATSSQMTFANMYTWAAYKGIDLVATADFVHPAWLDRIQEELIPDGNGFFDLRPTLRNRIDDAIYLSCSRRPQFILSTEISCIYKKHNRTRKVHVVILMPDLKSARALSRQLDRIGNVRSDGRPILGLDVYDLLARCLEINPEALFIPAHIWTPHFSVLGSFSGFASLEECFDDLTGQIYAVETGLSSDPAMNRLVSSLDKFQLVSSSDSHSLHNIGREATIFDCEKNWSYQFIRCSLKTGNPAGPGASPVVPGSSGLAGTVEFFPEEGKYHYDGHRDCRVCLHPDESRTLTDLCPACGRKLTIGVLHRVMELADRKKPVTIKPYHRFIPLRELISQQLGKGVASKAVHQHYFSLIEELGPELDILFNESWNDTELNRFPVLSALKSMRAGQVRITPGYDGQYGVIQPEP